MRRIYSLLILLGAVFLLASCNNNIIKTTTKTDTTTATQTTVDPVVTTTEDPVTTTEPIVTTTEEPVTTTTSTPTTTTAPVVTTTSNPTTTTTQKYTVSFNANGGSGTMADATEVLGEYTLPACTFTAPQGKEFKAWEVNGQENQPGDKINVSGNVTVKALWKDLPPQTFTVTFNSNGGFGNMPDVADVLGEYELPACTFTAPQGKEFKAWEVNNSEKQPGEAINVNSNTTVKALWKDVVVEKVTASFYDGTTLLSSTEINKGSSLTKPTAPTKTGYDFAGWFKEVELTNEVTFPLTLNENTSLFAKFTVKKLTVTLVLNGGTTTSLKIEVSYGETVELPTPTKGDVAFLGWYSDSSLKNAWDNQTVITDNISVYAKWDETSVELVSASGYAEGIFAEFVPFTSTSLTDYTIQYKKSDATKYSTLDKKLLRDYSTYYRFDILGLTPGFYEVVMKYDNQDCLRLSNVEVNSQDRSGYAHFGYTKGVGAYNDDGSLKSNAIIVYVTDETKNTVKATVNGKERTGLAEIIKAATKENSALVVRILGRIGAATWNPLTVSSYKEATNTTVKGVNGQYLKTGKNYDEEDITVGGFNTLNETTANKLNGLTNKIKYDSSKNEFDSYYNMLDVSGAQNVTIEGVGTDAEIFQWGFTWKGGNSIEVKNLTFTDYTEDACSFEGNGSDSDLTSFASFTSTHYWIHNNTFNVGKNYWDVCSEQDKHDGDGATDFKRVAYVTISYNHYIKNHKTGLVGGGDTQMSASLTFHHNFYDQCQSRLPFARQANMHMYNNYYYKSSGNNMQIYAGAYAFIEASYFEGVKNTFIIDARSTGKTPAVKSYNNTFDNCKYYSGATVVSARDTKVTNGNTFDANFDTSTTNFYYDSANKVSKVDYLTDAATAKTDALKYAGSGKLISPLKNETEEPNDPIIDDSVIDDPVEIENLLYNYNFNSINYDSIDSSKYKLTSNKTLGILTLVSTSSKSLELGTEETKFNDSYGNEVTVEKYIKTGGSSSKDGRQIIIDLSGLDSNKTYKIEIYTRSGNSNEDRTLVLKSGKYDGTLELTLTCPKDSILCNTLEGATNQKYYLSGTANSNSHILLIRIYENEA